MPFKTWTSSEFKAGDPRPSCGAVVGFRSHRARCLGVLQFPLPLAFSPGILTTSALTLTLHSTLSCLLISQPTWSSTCEAAGPFRVRPDRSSKSASRDQLSLEFLSLASGPNEDPATLHFHISLPATQTQPRDSNPSQLPQRPVSLAAVFVTPSRRTLPPRAAAARRRWAPKASAARLSGSCLDSRLLGNARGCFRRRWPRWAGPGRNCRWESATWESQAVF